jgi:hypothetical protein
MAERTIYVSLTSISHNQSELLETLKSIKAQTLQPTKTFIYLSTTPYLADEGFPNGTLTHSQLTQFLLTNSANFEVRWTMNTGPYRKLLPLLKETWNDDCLILTIDDDTVYMPTLIQNYVADYEQYQCCISYRGFTPESTDSNSIDYNKRQPSIPKYLYNFHTGKGGVLYHPRFFHSTGTFIFEKPDNFAPSADDIWFNVVRIANKIPCYIETKSYMIGDYTNNKALCKLYNTNQSNTDSMREGLQLIEAQGYLQKIETSNTK